ncbi:MAG: sialic acid TRAP transporter substrate-binding protein SiaP [Rhizobiales bacterium]|nr:sialic acid TRAP transporter substrate-binding protein SiaP [Hyphomicrobiales bacterium]OJY04953.1 MAG: TRAP dicarboxylate transporter subunit DctP [Rhizobiales bacterium 63-22]
MPLSMTRRSFVGASGGLAATLLLPRPTFAAGTVLRWATVLSNTHPFVTMMNDVAKSVHDDTNGAVDIQIFPDGQLGASRDLIEAASSGAIQIVDEGAAQFGQFVAPFSILEAPYIWRGPDHIRKVAASSIMSDMSDKLVANNGMRVLGATYYGKRHVTTGSKAVKTVADMHGFKLRIPEVDTYRAMTEAWGAKPTPLNIGELYLALSQGVVDGQENPLPTIQSAKLYEVQKYLVLTGHIITPRLVVVNESAWKGLDAKSQDALKAALAKFGKVQDDKILAQEAELAETFKKGGMTVIEPDVESFRKPVLATLPAMFEKKWGKGLWDRIVAM